MAQCSPIGASRLPLRLRNSQKTTPAKAVTATAPISATITAARVGPSTLARMGLTVAS